MKNAFGQFNDQDLEDFQKAYSQRIEQSSADFGSAGDFRYIGKKGKAHLITDGMQTKYLYGKEFTKWANQMMRGA